MDIAIIAPSPVPFNMGGVEKLLLGMYHYLDNHTNHRVELLKIPTKEHDFWSLIDSYRKFYELDVSYFDKVITTKYPAWMVRHHNHTVYLQHRLRGLYDTYHLFGLPEKVNTFHEEIIERILRFIDNDPHYERDLSELFELLEKLKQVYLDLPAELFQFPGPFIRKIIRYMDDWALSPKRIANYFCISKNVQNRDGYFPDGVKVDVVYHPSSFENLQEGSFDNYLFTVGRMDNAKRIELIVKAMKLTSCNVKLKIAGKGPDEEKIKEIAKDDPRIEFLGYVDNQTTEQLYRNALGVIYVPYDEDYGLVTIEAMKCGKPVITCEDSGGTLEFVTHLETGLVSKNTPEKLAKEIERLCNNHELAMEMGKRAKQKVEDISWERLVGTILSENVPSQNPGLHVAKKRKMLVLSTYPVFPRMHGGQLRIFNLYSRVTDLFDVTILSVNNHGENSYHAKLNGIEEICIQKSAQHQQREWEYEKHVKIPVSDVVIHELIEYTPKFLEELERQAEAADVIVCAQPYLFKQVQPFLNRKRIVYDSQNVEYDLKKAMYPTNATTKKLLDKLFQIENSACQFSNLVIACSEEDRARLIDLYKIKHEKTITIPNGVDVQKKPYIDRHERIRNKEKYGIAEEKIIVFIGSWHKPNLEAVEEIFVMARELPDCKFIVMGGLDSAFRDRNFPENVVLTGAVSEDLKNLVYSVADVAVNPMLSGSGTNLKIAEYISFGIPVVTTKIGARGYGFPEDVVVMADTKDFRAEIRKLLSAPERQVEMTKRARKFIEEYFDWDKISAKMIHSLESKILNS